MRSSLLVAAALVAALVSGPVLAQEAAPVADTAAPAVEAPVKATKALHKKHVKKTTHHNKKAHAAPAVETPAEAPVEAPAVAD